MTDTVFLLNAATAKHRAGDIDGAIAAYRDVLALDQKQPDALHMLGVAAQQKGNPQLALELIDLALAVKPELPFALHNRSLALRALKRLPEALQSSEQAVMADATHAEAWNMLGILARETEDFPRAFDAHAQAMRLQPDQAKFQAEYALTIYSQGDLTQAAQIMREALRRDANIPPLTLANILKSAGDPERALHYYQRAREMLPPNRDINASVAMALLQMGDYVQGWQIWEQRSDFDARFHAVPLWQGRKVEHLLVYEDQGLGDTLHFARYIPWLQTQGIRSTLCVAPSLQKLLTGALPGIDVISMDGVLPQADARVRLASLPFWHKTMLENIPPALPIAAQASGKLTAVLSPRVGLVWAGNVNNRNDRNRSLPFAALDPLLKAGGKHLVSLQKGRDEVAPGIFDAAPLLDDFADTAMLLNEIDLLITVDTAIAHLAGNMGKPAWLLVAFEADWRWLLGREDSPWYPSLRLFRQTKPGDWASIIAQIASELEKYLGGDQMVLRPTPYSGAPLRASPNAVVLD